MTKITIEDEDTTVTKVVGDEFDGAVAPLIEAFITMLLGLGFILTKSAFDISMAVDDFLENEDENREDKNDGEE